jgi:hypothetical protein
MPPVRFIIGTMTASQEMTSWNARPRFCFQVWPKGVKVTIFCWRQKAGGEDFHARYLLTERALPEAERAIADRVWAQLTARAVSNRAEARARIGRSRAGHRRARPAPSCLWRGANDHQQALRLVFQARLDIDAIDPEVDIMLGREVAFEPAGMFVRPHFLQSCDGQARVLRAMDMTMTITSAWTGGFSSAPRIRSLRILIDGRFQPRT